MIKKVLFTLSIAGIFGKAAQAQTIQPCGTDEVRREILVLHPEILDKEAKLNQQIADKIAAMSKKDLSPFAKTTEGSSTVAYDIPIVFHVIHDYGVSDVTDAQIIACVDRMNTLYNKKNADTIDVIAPFKGFINNSNTRYIGNARITWRLASKDPDGNPTKGITRRWNYITREASDLAKYDQWPPSSYMNIWLIDSFNDTHKGAAAYAYKPATADALPFYDGPIGLSAPATIGEGDYTYSHELGHELNLDHVWGGTNNPEVACGDDEVDDTPLTKGHKPGGCSPASLRDTACLFTRHKAMGKLRIDTFRRADSPAYTPVIFADTSTSKGITFQCRTASSLDTFKFYPSAPIGSTYKIGLKRGSVIIDSVTVVSTVTKEAQFVKYSFKLPITDTNTLFKLYFMQNPGAMRDTVTPGFSIYPRGVAGTVLFKNYITDSFYNFFYDWKVSYGFFKVYGDSLVDYPDTTNSQNVMDYTYCSKMFTAGQVERMRTTLTLSVAHRDSLVTPSNLAKTGALTTAVLKPKAELSVERAVTTAGIALPANLDRTYFMCSDPASSNLFKFRDRTWQATATSTSWDLSNGATVVTTGSGNAYKFTTPGWATVKLIATNAVGSDTFTANPGVYVADPTTANPIGYWQEFADAADNAKWPIFNYYNNRYKWETGNFGGLYDASSIRYRSYDDRSYPENLLGDASGDYDDFFSTAFDLSSLGTNGNLNFMYAGAYATTNPDYMKDQLEIAYSSNCGASWTVLKTMKNAEMQTVGTIPTAAREYTPAWNEWKPMSIDLKNGTVPVRDARVFFRFRYKPSSRPVNTSSGSLRYASGNNFYMDRINISNNPLSVNEMILGDRKATVAPNPTNANAFVLFQKPNAHVSIQVTDITGKLVYSVNEKVDQNNARIEIPASYLSAKGVYLVHITGDDNLNQTEKLIVY